jgi:hypothetical protein
MPSPAFWGNNGGGGSGSPGAAGESAYQEWLDAGHTGTQAQFLASLVGPQGNVGPTGSTGPAGSESLPSGVPNATSATVGALALASSASTAAFGGTRSTTPALTDGLLISDASTQSSPHTFNFGPRTTTALAYPTATMQPKTSALNFALDIAPSSGATNTGTNGMAWIDVCNQPVIDAGAGGNAAFAGTSLRLSNQNTFVEISSRNFSGSSSGNIPLYLGAGYAGSGNPQIYLGPMTAINPNVLIGYDGSDVFIGSNTAPATSAVRGGFLYLPSTAGAPTGVPVQANATWSALRYDSTNHKLWVYDSTAAAWKGVALA